MRLCIVVCVECIQDAGGIPNQLVVAGFDQVSAIGKFVLSVPHVSYPAPGGSLQWQRCGLNEKKVQTGKQLAHWLYYAAEKTVYIETRCKRLSGMQSDSRL